MLRSPQGGSFMLHRSISWQGERWPGHRPPRDVVWLWCRKFHHVWSWNVFEKDKLPFYVNDSNLTTIWSEIGTWSCCSQVLVRLTCATRCKDNTVLLVCMCVCKYVCMGRWCDAMESNVSMCINVGMPVGRRPGCDVWLWCAPSAQWDELFALLWSHQSGWGTGGILEGLWNQVISSCSSWRNIYIFCYWPLFVVATYHWKYANLYIICLPLYARCLVQWTVYLRWCCYFAQMVSIVWGDWNRCADVLFTIYHTT